MDRNNFKYKKNLYVLTDLVQPSVFGNARYDIVAIFKMVYSEEQSEYIFEFIDYFFEYGDDAETMIETAKEYIDRHDAK